MTPSLSSVGLVLVRLSACKPAADTTTPEAEGSGGWGDAPKATTAVPPAVDRLEPVEGAMPLGSKMWRRFGKGEWTAHTFFVPDAKAHAVTVILDMEGGGKDVPDPFEVVMEPQGLELVEGEPRFDGRVPPGQQRRVTWKLSAPQPGIAKLRLVTVKDGQEKGGS